MKKSSKFKLFSEDDKHFLIHDGSAHFPIAKKGLSDAEIKKINKLDKYQHFSDGGSVEDRVLAKKASQDKDNRLAMDNGEQQSPYSSDVQSLINKAKDVTPPRFANGGQHFSDGGEQEAPISGDAPASTSSLPPVPQAFQDPNVLANAANSQSQPQSFSLSNLSPTINPMAGLPEQSNSSSISDVAPSSDSLSINNSAPSTPQVVDRSPANPAVPQKVTANKDLNPIPQQLSEYDAGQQQEIQGAKDKAAAIAAVGKDTAKAHAAAAKALEEANVSWQARSNVLDKQYNETFKYLTAHPVDATHYWSSKEPMQKIGGAIAIMLGGLAGGLDRTHGNVAMDIINKGITDDIKAQENNLANKQSLLSQNLAATRNLNDARQLSYSQMAAAAAAQVAKATATGMGPEALAASQSVIGGLKKEAAQAHRGLAMGQALMSLTQDPRLANDPDAQGRVIGQLAALDPEKAKVFQAAHVPGVGTSKSLLPIPEDKRSEIINRNVLDKMTQHLRDFSAKYSGLLPTTLENKAIINKGTAMAQELQSKYREAALGTVYKESEKPLLNKMISDNPTAFLSNIRTEPGYQQVQESNRMALNELKKNYDLPIKNTPSPSSPNVNFRTFKPGK